MPIYEFQCGACGVAFEKLMKQGEAQTELCQVCGSDALELVLSVAELRFKGDGTYKKSED